jgi:sn-glycerol 3-phosphate transport system permease protein
MYVSFRKERGTLLMESVIEMATRDINRDELDNFKKKIFKKALFRRRASKLILTILNLFVALFLLLPLLYAVSIAFMPSNELFTTNLNLIPSTPTFNNFRQAMSKIPLNRFIVNSFIVAGLITMGQIISCSLAAFSFSFLNFKGKNVLFMLVMATMMIPGEATIISNYLTVSSLKWLDTYQVLIIPYLTSAMGIFLFRQFYKSFPISLYESAKIDGCSNLRFIYSILIPLTKSAIGAMAVYTFINAWNMYLWPLLVTGSDKMRTVQIGIGMLDSVDSQSISMMIAGVVMIIVPSISVFIIGQKQLIRGMFSGAVKG